MKRIFGLLLLLPFFALAQGKKDIKHTVGPKESLSSIGRMYNINGRELANYNHIEYDKGLTIGQVLNIPAANAAAAAPAATSPAPAKTTLSAKETPAKTVAATNTNGTPIYHTVGKKETLYHISTLYNKVPIEDIKKWNKLTGDGVNEGTKLIVGYSGSKPAKPAEDKITKAPAVVKEPAVINKPVETEPAVVPKPAEEKKSVEVKKEETKPEPVKTASGANKAGGGFFKDLYNIQTNGNAVLNESGTGGIFKSTSGWEDGKYYCLHNTAPAGTVIKITNTATGKSVFAKVLDLIPDIKQNNGLIIRISNAAAEALGITDNKMDCTLNYSK